MSGEHSLKVRRVVCVAIAVLFAGVSMGVTAQSSGLGGKAWTEEVLLHDGNKIIVDRVQNLGNRPTLDSRERKILDETITFSIPGANQRITWAMSFRDDIPEPNHVNVFLLGIANNVLYIAGYLPTCIAYNKWKRPNPPQVFFKYADEKWNRIAVSDFPLQLAEANLIVGGPAAEGIKAHYSVAQVQQENRNIDSPVYRTVLREPLPNPGGDCPEMIYYKCGWISPFGTFGRDFMDRTCK